MPIEISKLTSSHIGRTVIYTPRHWGGRLEEGVITNFNDRYIFVRYGKESDSKATSPDDLELLGPLNP